MFDERAPISTAVGPMPRLSPHARIRGGGGFSGDPHFVIPITTGMKLCFNFDGKTGEVNCDIFIDSVVKVSKNLNLTLTPQLIDGMSSTK